MRRLVLFLALALAVPQMVQAGERELTEERAKMQQQGRPLTTTEEEQLLERGWRDRRSQEPTVPVTSRVRPADYVSDVQRGTIDLLPGWRNYSYHTVRVPDGTMFDGNVMGGCNFTQIEPATDAFDRSPGFGHNLHFRDCNLVNVKTYPDWTIEGCNTTQVDRIGTFNREGAVDVTDSVVVGNRSDAVNPTRQRPVGTIERQAADDVVVPDAR